MSTSPNKRPCSSVIQCQQSTSSNVNVEDEVNIRSNDNNYILHRQHHHKQSSVGWAGWHKDLQLAAHKGVAELSVANSISPSIKNRKQKTPFYGSNPGNRRDFSSINFLISCLSLVR